MSAQIKKEIKITTRKTVNSGIASEYNTSEHPFADIFVQCNKVIVYPMGKFLAN